MPRNAGDRVNSSYIATTPVYPGLSHLLTTNLYTTPWDSYLGRRVIPYLISIWIHHYRLTLSRGQIAELTLDQFSYLFDVGPDRLIAAWTISRGRFPGDRPDHRIRRYPVSKRPVYHAGHAIPHRLGGGTDINLTAQVGALNVGAFRELENRAIKAPGSVYFTYWMYALDSSTQTASRIQQGLLRRDSPPEIKLFKN
jgi:hypothetical protein